MSDNRKSLPTITLFANSGHHFYFVPIDQFEAADAKGAIQPLKIIRELCVADDTPWTAIQDYPWIRYRPGMEYQNEPPHKTGFWIALETNVGTSDRGIIYEFEKPVEAKEIPRDFKGPVTPYAYSDVNQVDKKLLNIEIEIANPKNPDTREVIGKLILPPIQWQVPNANEPIDVDLIIDFGNTRSVAMLLECRDAGERLSSICRAVRFIRRGTDYKPFEYASAVEDPCTIIDSWVVLHETLFAEHEPPSPNFVPRIKDVIGDIPSGKGFLNIYKKPPKVGIVAKTAYMPQMFIEFSPVLLGGGYGIDGARQVLRESKLSQDKSFFLSSPKRYAWDNDQVGIGSKSFWNIELNRWNIDRDNETPHELPQLKGPVLLYMDQDGRFWDLDNGDPPPNERKAVHQRPHSKVKATFPPRDTLTWAAISIIESAFRQLNSETYRSGYKPWCPRRLRQIVVTFPSGWTTQELDNYRNQWQKAVNIFTLGHLQDRRRVDEGGERPLLIMDLDEAVASQLPVIFSESQKLGDPNAWLHLVGRNGNSESSTSDSNQYSNNKIVRIMNIDIGGGTTDVAIAEYQNTFPGKAVNLNATLLFKNSNTISGDGLVKLVIEKVLLPIMASSVRKEKQADFAQFFRDPREEWLATEPTWYRKMARVVHLALVPIVHHWLKEIVEGRHTDSDNSSLSPEKMLDKSKQRVVDPEMIIELNEMAKKFIGQDILMDSQPLEYEPEKINDCIRELFTPLFRSYGKLVAAFDCDLVFVSGKPSELPLIQEMLEQFLPLQASRIHMAKGYEVGSWYPVSAPAGKITDAKTITVVGAALRQAMTNGHIRDWRLTYTPANPALATGNYWGIMPNQDSPEQFENNILLNSEQTENRCSLMLGTRIGRMRYRSPSLMPDQIYVFRWRKDKERMDRNLPLQVKVKRITDKGFSELLQLVSVTGNDSSGNPVTIDDVELQLRTLADDTFWMDKPHFNFYEE